MKTILTSLTTFVLFILVGCSPKYYIPNTQNTPFISEKGETNLSFAGNGNQIEFQGAHGITNHFAMQANGGWYIPSNLDNGNGGSGKFFEVAPGYYTPLGEKLVFETYGLFGYGSLENHFPSTLENYPNTTGSITANAYRYGIQPNFGFKSKYFTAGISSRLVALSYININGSLIFDDVNQIVYLQSNDFHWLFEPALTLRAGVERIKVQMQLGNSFNLTTNSFKQDNLLLTLGLNFNFK